MSDQPTGPVQPTVPVDLIADLHAGVLPEDEARAVRARVEADPASRRVLAALDATVDDLRGAPVEPMEPPPAVAAAIEATLRSLRDGDAPPQSAPGPADDPRVVDLDVARDVRRRRGLLVAAAVAVVVAVVSGVIAISTASQPPSETVRANESETVRADQSASPSPGSTAGTASTVALLSVIGRTDPGLGSPDDPGSRLRGCLSANGVPATVGVVGSGPVVLDGNPRIVVLLTTGVAGRFEALVVGEGCAAGRAETMSRQVIGVTPSTR
ncbi:MAG: hypothetical protein PGN29_15560 [Gordonia paraffinivorans]